MNLNHTEPEVQEFLGRMRFSDNLENVFKGDFPRERAGFEISIIDDGIEESFFFGYKLSDKHQLIKKSAKFLDAQVALGYVTSDEMAAAAGICNHPQREWYLSQINTLFPGLITTFRSTGSVVGGFGIGELSDLINARKDFLVQHRGFIKKSFTEKSNGSEP